MFRVALFKLFNFGSSLICFTLGDQAGERRDAGAASSFDGTAVLYVDRFALPVLPNRQPSVDRASERERGRVLADYGAVVDALRSWCAHRFAERRTRFGVRVPRADEHDGDDQ